MNPTSSHHMSTMYSTHNTQDRSQFLIKNIRMAARLPQAQGCLYPYTHTWTRRAERANYILCSRPDGQQYWHPVDLDLHIETYKAGVLERR